MARVRPWPTVLFLCALIPLLFSFPPGIRPAAAALSDTTAAPGARGDTYFRLSKVSFENDGTWLKISIPLAAPWSHSTLPDPPRIVIDLDNTLSLLPKSPGLYQVRMDRGPLVLLRTSQNRLTAKERRARITLELTRMVPYQARRIGDEIQILIPDPVERNPRALVLGPDGLSEAQGSSVAPARSLREALEAVVGSHNVLDLGQPPPEQGSGFDPGSLPSFAGHATNSSHSPSPSAAGANTSPRPSSASPGQDAVMAAGGSAADRGAEAAPPVMDGPRERSAARLLRQALQCWRRGDAMKAAVLAERAHHFYAGTRSGGQAGLLLREIWILLGKDSEAEQLQNLPDHPDTSVIPVAVFLDLARRHEEGPDMTRLDRLLRQWGPSYGPVADLAQMHLALARAYMTARQADLARQHLEQIPSNDPAEPAALLLLARIADEGGDKAKALELYRRVAILPGGSLSLRGMARAADLEFQSGRVSEALASYEKLLGNSPPRDEEAWAVFQTGNCHLLLGDLAEARLRYEAIAQRWPQSFWAPFARDRLEELKWRERLSGKAEARQGR